MSKINNLNPVQVLQRNETSRDRSKGRADIILTRRSFNVFQSAKQTEKPKASAADSMRLLKLPLSAPSTKPPKKKKIILISD